MWTVPADRMKAKREHRVPLASRAMEVLTEARRLADDSGLIFPSTTGRGPLGANTLTKLSHELRLGCTPHGMRSSFRTWCGETEQPRELAEQALAHVNPNRVRGGLHALRPVRATTGADGSLERLPLATECTVTC